MLPTCEKRLLGKHSKQAIMCLSWRFQISNSRGFAPWQAGAPLSQSTPRQNNLECSHGVISPSTCDMKDICKQTRGSSCLQRQQFFHFDKAEDLMNIHGRSVPISQRRRPLPFISALMLPFLDQPAIWEIFASKHKEEQVHPSRKVRHNHL